MAKRRTHALALMSISSGMPYGVLITGPLIAFLRSIGVSLQDIGLISLATAPWTFKFIWSPLVDRYALRWPDRRRSWVVLSQVLLAISLLAFALFAFRAVNGGAQPSQLWAIGALALLIAFAGATQDIALDAYAVEYLRPEEQGPVSGLRIMYWRIGWLLCSGAAIALSDPLLWNKLGVPAEGNSPWPWVFVGIGAAFLLVIPITLAGDPPEQPAIAPRTLGSAVVEPLVSYFKRPEALWFAAFLVLYKFGDNLSASVWIQFLVDHQIPRVEIGLLNKTLGMAMAVGGAVLGGWLTTRLGLGRALWMFGAIQGASSALFGLASVVGAARWAVYLGIGGENLSAGLGTAAQGVLCLRLCEKRFGATQFALLSSLFALGRWLTGPIAGWSAQHLGYTTHFFLAVLAAVPGLLVLQHIAPIQQREVPAALPVVPEAAPT